MQLHGGRSSFYGNMLREGGEPFGAYSYCESCTKGRQKGVLFSFSTGGGNVENAVTWIVEHENDPDIDEMPKVSAARWSFLSR